MTSSWPRIAMMRQPVLLLAMPALVVVTIVPVRAQNPAVGAARGAANKLQTPSIKAVMARIGGRDPGALTPAIGQALKAPSPDWATIQTQAKEYAELATALGKNSPRMGPKESWDQLTADFSEAANDLAKAANDKDLAAAKTAHDQLANSCMACHRVHRGRGGPGMGGPPGGFAFGGPPGGPGRPGLGGPPPGGSPPGGPGAPGAAPGAEERGPAGPATTPEGTVQAFLDALKESDAEALSRLVARRPVAELMVRSHKKTLDGIVGKKLSDKELDALVKEFEGATIDGRPASAGGGKVAITLAQGGAKRKVYVVREGEHWRVVDYGVKNSATAKAKATRAR
jgi:cytochrome c556